MGELWRVRGVALTCGMPLEVTIEGLIDGAWRGSEEEARGAVDRIMADPRFAISRAYVGGVLVVEAVPAETPPLLVHLIGRKQT